jgi:hypothetical protein
VEAATISLDLFDRLVKTNALESEENAVKDEENNTVELDLD